MFDALHLARVRGLAPRESLGDVDALVDAGLLTLTNSGGILTPAGLARHDELLAQWRETIDLEGLAAAYERFLTVNQPVKDACSRWQGQEDDPEALFLVADELSGLLERVQPALRRAGEAAARFATYPPRLQAALDAAGGGDARFITDPRVDSVHTIWFECHEDFLTTLGRDREEEGSY